ncbi:MAG: hypothetical protein EXS59_02660 [Candidatus Taylorbacteria bacterium]|nr:hypothetical protein [Candidatus Taylorbacteria bacterium]
MNSTATSIIIAGLIIGGAIVFVAKPPSQSDSEQATVENVSLEQGRQIVELKAKGGFAPRVSTAKAGVSTVLRINTKGTFDCSSSVRIPSLGISKLLPSSGVTDIDLGTQPIGTLLGSCGMGMYPFEIEFKS